MKCVLLLLCVLVLSAQAALPPRVSLSYAPGGEEIQGSVMLRGIRERKNLKVRITATDQELPAEERKEITVGEWKVPETGPVRFTRKTAELPERRKLLCKVAVLNAAGQELAVEEVPLTTPANPAHWRNFTGGMPGKEVPAPWTPVILDGKRVKVWGREFIFEDSPLPVQIFSQGQKLLAAPAELKLHPAPKRWKLLFSRRVDDTTVKMRWEGEVNGGKPYRADVEIYFDGVMRLDMTFPKGSSVSRYSQIYPLRPEIAKTLHRGPWAFGGIKTTYPVKDSEDNHPIRPQMFLFNDEVGFGWFDGMEFDWPLADKGKALQVIPGKDAVRMVVNYIDGITVMQNGRVYSTGLEPLPVRPMPEEEKAMRMCYAITYEDVNYRAWNGTVDYHPDGNVRQEQGTVEMSVRLDFDPENHSKSEELFYETTHGMWLRLKFGWSKQNGIFAQIYEYGVTKVRVDTGVHPEQGEWHHLALSWGDEMAVFIDGVKAGSAPHKGSGSVLPGMLHVGGVNVSVDGLKISGRPRTDFVIDAPPVEDSDTLLLDNFDKTGYCNGRIASFAEKISESAEVGYPTPDAVIGAGRWGLGINPMTAAPKNLIEGYREYGIDTFCFHASQPTDEAMAGMYINQPEKMRQTVEEIHRLGGRALVYIGNGLSTMDRSWSAHEADWLIAPRGYPFIPANSPNDKSHQACPRSGYIDYFFWRLDTNLKEFNLDGAFLDGRMYTTCHNVLHGCEVTNFEGKKVAKRDVWDGRMKAWRLYNIIHENGGYAEQHKSSIWDAPTCFFWDGVWEGEQFMMQKWSPESGKKRTDILPIEAMRSQMNGFVYGMPSRFTAYAYQPFVPQDYCTYSFVHGCTWTMTYRIFEAAVTAPYWKALDNFGATYSRFRPYWGNAPLATSVPHELVKVSGYVKPGEALLIIANFNEDAPRTAGKVRFDGANAGLPGPWQAFDAFSGEKIPVSPEGDIPIDIKSFRQSWIIVRSAQ